MLSPLVWLIASFFFQILNVCMAESQPVVRWAHRHSREFKIGVSADGLLRLLLLQRGGQRGGVLDRVKFLALSV